MQPCGMLGEESCQPRRYRRLRRCRGCAKDSRRQCTGGRGRELVDFSLSLCDAVVAHRAIPVFRRRLKPVDAHLERTGCVQELMRGRLVQVVGALIAVCEPHVTGGGPSHRPQFSFKDSVVFADLARLPGDDQGSAGGETEDDAGPGVRIVLRDGFVKDGDVGGQSEQCRVEFAGFGQINVGRGFVQEVLVSAIHEENFAGGGTPHMPKVAVQSGLGQSDGGGVVGDDAGAAGDEDTVPADFDLVRRLQILRERPVMVGRRPGEVVDVEGEEAEAMVVACPYFVKVVVPVIVVCGVVDETFVPVVRAFGNRQLSPDADCGALGVDMVPTHGADRPGSDAAGQAHDTNQQYHQCYCKNTFPLH